MITGPAMAPNYENGEKYLACKLFYKVSKPSRGDVILFEYAQSLGYTYVGRIIALPGDVLLIGDGKVYIDGQELKEEYLAPGAETESMGAREFKEVGNYQGVLEETGFQGFISEDQKITIPVDSYFVMGDNRNESIDSRSLGLVNSKDIIGKLLLKY